MPSSMYMLTSLAELLLTRGIAGVIDQTSRLRLAPLLQCWDGAMKKQMAVSTTIFSWFCCAVFSEKWWAYKNRARNASEEV